MEQVERGGGEQREQAMGLLGGVSGARRANNRTAAPRCTLACFGTGHLSLLQKSCSDNWNTRADEGILRMLMI
ncbi:uncharacterized [Tachysurus ichikawai]